MILSELLAGGQSAPSASSGVLALPMSLGSSRSRGDRGLQVARISRPSQPPRPARAGGQHRPGARSSTQELAW